jgi:hypothetical protein
VSAHRSGFWSLRAAAGAALAALVATAFLACLSPDHLLDGLALDSLCV